MREPPRDRRPDPRAIPLALYVHVPWCARKCPYCDFNSHAVREPPDEAAYLAALLADLDQDLPLVLGRSLTSVFVGGGTPSLLSGRFVGRLLEAVDQRLGIGAGTEVTLEANPGAADAARFAAYRAAGVNRLSIGVQSFDDASLAALGRIHDGREALAAAEAARHAGLENLNLDLMFALPGQTVAGALADLRRAVDLGPPHLSWYQLTVEPNTAFAAAPPALPSEDLAAEMQEEGLHRLAAAGYAHYEVSAHALPGRQCRHNLNYWQFGDYLGIGAGAHGKLTLADGTIERRWKPRHPADYLASAGTKLGIAGRGVLDAADLRLELALNALRLRDGVPLALVESRTGLEAAALAGPVAQGLERGLLERSDDRLMASALGWRFLNRLIMLFGPE
jgi:oxygen-independent coproporphyrinogen-3 oxidase